jgi:hypothetical protein
MRDFVARAASYVDKILRGAKPGELPVEQPTKFELIVNLRTAAALNLTHAGAAAAARDEVIAVGSPARRSNGSRMARHGAFGRCRDVRRSRESPPSKPRATPQSTSTGNPWDC